MVLRHNPDVIFTPLHYKESSAKRRTWELKNKIKECIKRAAVIQCEVHLFLIINTLVCFWQVESRRGSALHYSENHLKREELIVLHSTYMQRKYIGGGSMLSVL